MSVDRTHQNDVARDSFNDPDTPMSPEASSLPRLPSLTFESLSEADLVKIAQAFPRAVKSADIKTTKMFKAAFVGKTAVDWFESKVPAVVGKEASHSCSRAVGVQVGQWLLLHGYIWCCEGQKIKDEFQDDSPCYRHLSAILLLDDPITHEVATNLAAKMKAQDTGVPLKEEKVLMKKVKGSVVSSLSIFQLDDYVF